MSLLRKIQSLVGGESDDDWRNRVPTPILKWVKPGSEITVVDLGANNGDFTRALSKQYQISKCILGEPLENLAEKLRQEFTGPAFHVVQSAISDCEGLAEFEVNESEATSSLLKIKRDLPEHAGVALGRGRMVQVRTQTLDAVTAELGFKQIDILKIDVQGAEDKVLTGASEALKKTNVIWIEVSFKSLYEGAVTYPHIYAMLEAGFRAVEMQPAFRGPDGEILQSDVLFVRRGVAKPS